MEARIGLEALFFAVFMGIGGSALFFSLCNKVKKAILIDSNLELVITYNAIKKEPRELIEKLKKHAKFHSEEHYYFARQNKPTSPDHSYFGKLRKRLGTKNVGDIFNKVNETLRSKGLFGDVFKFIDASTVITKSALWEERDRAIKAGEEKLNNAVVSKYAVDKDAKWGAKGKNKN